MGGKNLQKCQMPKEPGGSGGKEELLRKGTIHPLYSSLVPPCKTGWLLVQPNKMRGSYSDCPLVTPTTVGPKKGVNNSTFPTGGKVELLSKRKQAPFCEEALLILEVTCLTLFSTLALLFGHPPVLLEEGCSSCLAEEHVLQ